MASESFFFAAALDPEGNGSEGTKVEVIAPAALADTNLDEYDLVAMINVSDLPVMMDAKGKAYWPGVQALEDYVRVGGGLAIFSGDRVNPAFYNGPLYAEGQGLSPLRIGQSKGKPSQRKEFFRIDPKSIVAESVMRVFLDYLAAGVDPTQFVRFYAFTSATPAGPAASHGNVKPPRILARFADPDASPAIAARQFGRGTVLMYYTAPTIEWNDWPADENGTFVAMLNDVVRYLAAERQTNLSATVDVPIVYELPRELREATAILTTPLSPAEPAVSLTAAAVTSSRDKGDGATTTAPADGTQSDRGRRMELRFDRPRTAGTYSLELSVPGEAARRVLFARRVDPAEGDLTCGREPAVTAAMGNDRVIYVDRRSTDASQVARADSGKEYWMWALGALVILLAAETFLGQRFGHWPGGKGTKDDVARNTAQSQKSK